MTNWQFQPIFGSYLLLFAIATGSLSLLLIAPRFTTATRSRRIVLQVLRAVVILLLLLAMLRPTLVHTKTEPVEATIVFLVDCSRSMLINDGGEDSRWTKLRQSLDQSRREFQQLDRVYDLTALRFDSKTGELPITADGITLPRRPDGNETDIALAIEGAVEQTANEQVLAFVLLSDGAQRVISPRSDIRDAARQLERRGCPLYTVPFGLSRDAAQSRDIAVQNLQDYYRVFANTDLNIRATIQASGYANTDPIPVQLLLETAAGNAIEIDSTSVTPVENVEQLDVSFTFRPDLPGQFKISVVVPDQQGEQVTENNLLSAYVDVIEGGLRVLYLCGNLGWQEQKFVRRVIDGSPEMQLDFQWIDPRGRDDWPIDLKSTLQNGDYDVILIGDLDVNAVGDQGALLLADEISEGTGFMMIGGKYAFGPGGYAGSALEPVLPVIMDNLQRQSPGQPLRPDLHWIEPQQLVPKSPHFITTLAASQDNFAVWKSLPPLLGANRFDSPRMTAQPLLVNQDGQPILLAGEFGLGRILAFAGDSTYRWYRRGFQEAHGRFWRQCILWLAKKDQAENTSLWIELEQRRFSAGARAKFTAGIRPPEGELIERPELNGELVLPNGERKSVSLSRRSSSLNPRTDGSADNEPGATRMPDKDGLVWDGITDQLISPGDYRLEVRANADGQFLARSETRFTVVDRDLELSDPAANPKQLAALADITQDQGGRMVAPEELPRLLEELESQPLDAKVEYQSKWQLTDTPWDAWLFFASVVVLLSTEWFLRKKWNMV